jgi:hypothetical protein
VKSSGRGLQGRRVGGGVPSSRWAGPEEAGCQRREDGGQWSKLSKGEGEAWLVRWREENDVELSHPVFKPKLNAHSMCAQESSLHTYRTENRDRIINVSI